MSLTLWSATYFAGLALIVISVLGGGFEVKEIKVPTLARIPRILSFVCGLLFLALGLYQDKSFEKPTGLANLVESENGARKSVGSESFADLYDTNNQFIGVYPKVIFNQRNTSGNAITFSSNGKWGNPPPSLIVTTIPASQNPNFLVEQFNKLVSLNVKWRSACRLREKMMFVMQLNLNDRWTCAVARNENGYIESIVAEYQQSQTDNFKDWEDTIPLYFTTNARRSPLVVDGANCVPISGAPSARAD